MLSREIAINLCIKILESNNEQNNISNININIVKLFEWWNNIPNDIQVRLKENKDVLFSAIGYNNFINEIVTYKTI